MSLTTLPIPVQPQAGVATIPDFGFATFCRNASELGGGDVCEVLRLSGSSLLLIMADVMGKGAGASVFAGAFRTLARAVAHPQVDPASCLAEINELMFSELSKKDTFITAQLVVADLKNRQLLVANAGHCPMLVADGSIRCRRLPPRACPWESSRVLRSNPTVCRWSHSVQSCSIPTASRKPGMRLASSLDSSGLNAGFPRPEQPRERPPS